MLFRQTVIYLTLVLLVSGCGVGNQPFVAEQRLIPVKPSINGTQNSDAAMCLDKLLMLPINLFPICAGVAGQVAGQDAQLKGAAVGSYTGGRVEVVNAGGPASDSGASLATTPVQPNPPGFEPWPPPRPTDSRDLNDLFSDNNKFRTLGNIQNFFETALEKSGVYEFSYFNAPGGFALVTPIEQLSSTGTLKADTEMTAKIHNSDWFKDWLSLLFVCPKGYYGAVVFFVTTDPQGPNMKLTVTGTQLRNWSIGGLRGLPDAIRNEPAKDHYIYADIYNFEQSDDQQLVLLDDNVFNPDDQLASLGIISKRRFQQ